MAAQTEYSRGTSFTDAQAAAPSTPPSGPALDGEFDRVKIALDTTQQSLELIQRDDGRLANNSVGIDQIDPEIYTGLRPATQWAATVNYAVNDTVFYVSGSVVGLYRCEDSHTSSVFSNDLLAGHWLLLFDYTPPVTVGVTPIANGGTGASDASTARANLGLGALATASVVAIDQGGTGAGDAPTARGNLGLAIGTDVLAYDAKLAAEAALSPIADRLSYYTGATTKNTTAFPSSARSLLGLSPVADRIPYFSGSSTATLATFTAAARALLDDADAAAMLTTLGVSTFIKTLVDDADEAAARATLGAQPVAISGTGIGQFTTLLAGPSTALSLPAGGTWLYYYIRESTASGVFQSHATGVAAGGTQIASSTAGVNTFGFAWRIG